MLVTDMNVTIREIYESDYPAVLSLWKNELNNNRTTILVYDKILINKIYGRSKQFRISLSYSSMRYLY